MSQAIRRPMRHSEARQKFPTTNAAMPRDAMWFSDRGLWVGDILIVDHGAPQEGLAKLEAMLAIAFQKRLSKSVALDDSRRGDQGLANLRLAVVRHARIADAVDLPLRMAEAKRLLATGLSPDELLASFAIGHAYDDLTKFNPEQPRVPAGSGRESGRWARGQGDGSTSSAVAAGAIAFAPSEAPLLAPSLGAETLAALSTFAETVGLAAVFGTLFVPSPNATSSSGPLPGDTENTYSYDHEDGLLRVLGPSGVVLAAGQKDGSGVFFDADTGLPFARLIGGALVFDGGSLQALAVQANPATAATTTTEADEDEEDQPKLCPDPGLDQPGSISASARARAYQEQISFMTNPQRPLPFGLAMNLTNPVTGAIVHYDECDEQTGTMIEAKGPGFAGLLSFPQGYNNVTTDWLRQGTSELQAAGTRQVVWYFAEDRAASTARSFFASKGLGKIIVIYQPPV